MIVNIHHHEHMTYDLECQYLCLEGPEQEIPEAPDLLTRPVAASSPGIPPRAEYLDGLRGLAALFVFFSHITPDFTRGIHEHGFGEDGVHWHPTSFPFFRLIWSGGNPAVSIFFVLSGYALSIGPLSKMKEGTSNGRGAHLRRSLLGAIARRPIRLYGPALAVALIQAVLLQIPGLVVVDPELPPSPQANLVDELDFLISKLGYFNPFTEHGVDDFFPYNRVVWTLPIELKGSLLVYTVLILLSMGVVSGPSIAMPTALTVAAFLGGAIAMQISTNWVISCFTWGVALAMLDLWPIGEHLRNKVRGAYGRRAAVHIIAKLLRSITRALSARPKRVSWSGKPKTFAHACFIVGWYLLSQPGYPGHRWYSANTPGWRWLTSMIPSVYDDARFHRYWTAIGAVLMVYAVLRIQWLKKFLERQTLKFLGTISFSLYLVHLPWTHVFSDRIKSLLGGYVNPSLAGGIWDHRLEISDMGPPGLSPRFLVSMVVIVPSTLLVAWLWTVAVDQPSVRLGKWFTRKIGIDRSIVKG